MSAISMVGAVFPLFAEDNPGQHSFAGTGFFVTQNGKRRLVTANHVIGGRKIFLFKIPDDSGTHFQLIDALHPMRLLANDAATDLAVFETIEFEAKQAFELAERPPFFNLRVGTFEFARFTLDKLKLKIDTGASSRIGNIIRIVNLEGFPTDTLELSFPALKGASGAPVVILEGSDTFKVTGALLANVQYELMPAQTYFYKDARDNSEETTHYYLPAGLAVSASHLSTLLNTLPDASVGNQATA